MPWQTEAPAPPVRPSVPGWFAIFNLVSTQQFAMTDLATVIGVMAALQSAPLTNAATTKGLQNAAQTVAIVNAGLGAVKPTTAQSFTITDSATLRGHPLAAQALTLTQLATAVALSAALQSAPIASGATTKGLQNGNQAFAITDAALAAGARVAGQSFSVTEAATVIGKPSANNPLLITGLGSVVGVVLSPQQVSLLNQGVVTGSEAIVTGPQFFAISDAATVAGVRAAAQSFTVVNGASWYGKPGAAQVVAITESGVAKGIAAANVSFTITATGAVYTQLVGAQSFSMSNTPASWYGAPDSAQSFSMSNFAAAVSGSLPAFDKVTAGPTSTTFTTTNSYTFNVTPVAASNVGVVVVIELAASGTAIDWLDPATTTVTYGGVAMTRIGAVWAGNATSQPANGKGVWVYGLTSAANTAQGASAHTVSIINSAAGRSVAGSAMCCMTFTDVLAFGTPTTNFASATSTGVKSVILSSAAGRIPIGVFIKGGTTSLSAWSAFNQTQRFNTVTNGFSNTITSAYAGGTATGASSVTFSATTAGTISDGWGAIAFDIR